MTEPSEIGIVRQMFCLNPKQEHQCGHEQSFCRADEGRDGKNKKNAPTMRPVTGRWEHTAKDR